MINKTFDSHYAKTINKSVTLAIRVIEKLHLKIFGEYINQKSFELIKGLSWSTLGVSVSGFIMYLITIYVGRTIGPTELGNYNQIVSLASSLMIFILLGNNISSIRFLADIDFQKHYKRFFTLIVAITAIQLLVVSIILIVVSVNNYINIDRSAISLLIALTVLLSLRSLLDSLLRANNQIINQTKFRIIESVIIAVVFCAILIATKQYNYKNYIYSTLIGYCTFIILGIGSIPKKFEMFSKYEILKLFHYNKYLLLGSFAGIIIGLEKYFVGRTLGPTMLGIYSAYHSITFLIISNIGAIFLNVFFPLSIKEKKNMSFITQGLHKIIKTGLIPWLLIGTLFSFVSIHLFGQNFSPNIMTSFLFCYAAYSSFSFSLMISNLSINNIKQSVVYQTICYSLAISSLVFARNIETYLLLQSIFFSYFYYLVYRKITILPNYK